MPIKSNLTGLGMPAALAAAVCGNSASVTGAGTTRTDAALLPLTGLVIITGASNSGVILPPGNGSTDGMSTGDSMVIYNTGSNTVLLYPPTGGQLNDGTASTGTVSIPTHTSVTAIAQTNLLFIVSGPTT